jgi:hypothetical protein
MMHNQTETSFFKQFQTYLPTGLHQLNTCRVGLSLGILYLSISMGRIHDQL